MKINTKHIKDFFLTLLASALFAVGMELFILPNRLNIGGFGGIAQLFSLLNTRYISTGIWLIILNAPIVVLAFYKLPTTVARNTLIEVLFAGAFMELLYRLDVAARLAVDFSDNLAITAVIGGLLVAASSAIMIGIDGSTGGNDVVGMLVQKKYRVSNVTRILTAVDVVIALFYSLAVGNAMLTIYSVTALVAYQVALELILNGLSNAVMFEVVTNNPSALIAAIGAELERGTTRFKAVGTYTGREKDVVVCVVGRRQEAAARELIRRVAPESFAYALPVKNVIGEGFKEVKYK